VDAACRARVAALGKAGFLKACVPAEFGGLHPKLDVRTLCIARETLAFRDGLADFAFAMQGLGTGSISLYGTPELKARYLPPVREGKAIAAFALSEPEAGSDAKAQRTRAVKDGDRWVLNGTKNFITNAPVADVMITFATTDPAKGSRGITAFLIPMDTPGLKVGPPDDKLGIRGALSAQVFLADCAVGDDARLGPEGDGFKIAMRALDGGRIGVAAQALGIARAAFEDATRYALERKTFGQPIAEHQAIQFKLADMRTEIDAARLLLWRAAVTKDRGGRYGRDASMAKLFGSEVANRVAKEALQIFGGYGYLTDFPAERHFRDAKITEIYEGTSEIQRLVIASSLLKE